MLSPCLFAASSVCSLWGETMTEPTLWRQCDNSFHDDPEEYRDNCPECDGFERRGLVPVAADAVFAEDRGQAIERMLPILRELLMVDHHDELLRMELRKLLAAAEWRET